MKTIHEYRGFVFTIEFVAEDPAWVVDFPDLPEIITSGADLDEAFHNACEALDLYLEVKAKFNELVTQPTRRLKIVEVA